MHAKTNKTNKMTLKEWYDNLPAKDQSEKRNELINACGISVKTFYSWTRAEHIPKKAMQKAINEVAKIDIHFTNNAEMAAANLPFVQ
jgi:hypothetical protein